jgi:hypothetical protein
MRELALAFVFVVVWASASRSVFKLTKFDRRSLIFGTIVRAAGLTAFLLRGGSRNSDQEEYLRVGKLVVSEGPFILRQYPSYVGSALLNAIGIALPGVIPVTLFVAVLALLATTATQMLLLDTLSVFDLNRSTKMATRYFLVVFPSSLIFLSLPLKEPFICLGIALFFSGYFQKSNPKIFVGILIVSMFRFYLTPLLVIALVSGSLAKNLRARRGLQRGFLAFGSAVVFVLMVQEATNESFDKQLYGSFLTGGSSLMGTLSPLGFYGNAVMRGLLLPIPPVASTPLTLLMVCEAFVFLSVLFWCCAKLGKADLKSDIVVTLLSFLFGTLAINALTSQNVGTLMRIRIPALIPLILLFGISSSRSARPKSAVNRTRTVSRAAMRLTPEGQSMADGARPLSIFRHLN